MNNLQPDEVKAARAQLGLTQAAFGERLGVGKDVVRDWERGKRACPGPASRLIRLVLALQSEEPPASIAARCANVWHDIREAILEALWR